MFRERFYSLRIERNLVWNTEANVVSRDKISLRFHEHRIVYKHAFYTLQRTRGIARAYNLPWCLSNVYKISLSLYTYIYIYYCVAVGRIWGSFSCPSTGGSGRRTHEGLPMHPLGGREYRVAWLIPGLASGCLLSPRNIFSYASFRRKTFPSFSLSYISLPYVESHTFRTSMFSFLFQSRTPLVYRLTVFFSSFVIDRLSIFSLFPRTSDIFFRFRTFVSTSVFTFPFFRDRSTDENLLAWCLLEPTVLRLTLDLASDLCIPLAIQLRFFASLVGPTSVCIQIELVYSCSSGLSTLSAHSKYPLYPLSLKIRC